MKREMVNVGASVIAIIWAMRLWATPSTHIWAPSTDIESWGSVHLTVDMYLPTERIEGDGRAPAVTNLGLTLGVLPFEKVGAEVGFDHKQGVGSDTYPWYFNFKIGVRENAFGKFFPAVAGGVYDIGIKSNVTDYNVVYGKVAKTFKWVGRFSLGYFYGNSHLLTDSNGKSDNHGIFVAWEECFMKSGGFVLSIWEQKALMEV